jgi:hypothetical protein
MPLKSHLHAHDNFSLAVMTPNRTRIAILATKVHFLALLSSACRLEQARGSYCEILQEHGERLQEGGFFIVLACRADG